MNISDLCINKPQTHKSSDTEYLNWFNHCSSVDDAMKTGALTFSHQLLTPDLLDIIGYPKDKTALEIGFGGGRLINAASHYFSHVIGIDIHTSFDKTRQILNDQNVCNYSLLHYDDCNEIKDESIDFIYSFIVFQHFASWHVAKQYLDLLSRVMKPNSCGHIFFGRSYTDCVLMPERNGDDWWLSLCVSPDFVTNEFENYFQVLEVCDGDLFGRKSAQFSIKFRK